MPALADTAPVAAPPDAGAAPHWRIVIVEDSVDDAELACIALADAGLDVDCRCVDSEAGLVQALASFAPHLVLSDQGLPGFSGTRALELARARAPSVPFVFVSGEPEPGEGETAAATPPAPKPVADAWLHKDELAQLPALVRRLLAG